MFFVSVTVFRLKFWLCVCGYVLLSTGFVLIFFSLLVRSIHWCINTGAMSDLFIWIIGTYPWLGDLFYWFCLWFFGDLVVFKQFHFLNLIKLHFIVLENTSFIVDRIPQFSVLHFRTHYMLLEPITFSHFFSSNLQYSISIFTQISLLPRMNKITKNW